jgi:hypothetical protein
LFAQPFNTLSPYRQLKAQTQGQKSASSVVVRALNGFNFASSYRTILDGSICLKTAPIKFNGKVYTFFNILF